MNYEKISWLRAPVEFIKIYWPVPDGEWHLESFDRLLENCERNGVTYIPLLEWPPDAFKPIVEHLDKWEEYCFQMALRYGSRLPALEVLNEPNMNLSPEDFTKILKASARAIRKANPDVKIIYGGPGTYSPRHADPRLLAIPASCRRVAACNPN